MHINWIRRKKITIPIKSVDKLYKHLNFIVDLAGIRT